MALTFQQTDDVSQCAPMAACAPAPATPIEAPLVDTAMRVGGTPGSVEETMDIPAGSSVYKTFFQSGQVGEADWPGGDWTVNINISTAQNNITLSGVWICRIKDDCTPDVAVGSNTTSYDASTVGVISVPVTGTLTSGLATDRVYIVCEFSNSHSMTARTVGVTPSETVASPITESESVTVSTGTATDITGTSATLNGTLDSFSGATSADVWFEWRQVGATVWNTTPVQTLTATGAFSAPISGLTASTDYEFRAQASTTNTSSTGTISTFTTARVIAGTVYAPGGTGQSGATVHIINTTASPSEHVATLTTAADGTFSHETTVSGDLHVVPQYDDGTTKYNALSHHSLRREGEGGYGTTGYGTTGYGN